MMILLSKMIVLLLKNDEFFYWNVMICDRFSQCPGVTSENNNRLRRRCSSGCWCCFDPNHCPATWIDDGECDAICDNDEHNW